MAARQEQRFARNALRLATAGAGIAVLGAGFVGQASADEEPTANPDAEALPDSSQVQDNYEPPGGDSADFTDEQESASPFPAFPGGGTFAPLQTVPSPQDALATENLQSFFVPEGEDIAALLANPLNDEG